MSIPPDCTYHCLITLIYELWSERSEKSLLNCIKYFVSTEHFHHSTFMNELWSNGIENIYPLILPIFPDLLTLFGIFGEGLHKRLFRMGGGFHVQNTPKYPFFNAKKTAHFLQISSCTKYQKPLKKAIFA